jgi:hypothetical protein
LTIGRLTLAVAGVSLVFALWDVSVFYVDMPRTPLDVVPFVATPLLCIAGLIIGAIGWSTRRKTDGDSCLIGAILCLTIFIASSYAIGRVLIGVR